MSSRLHIMILDSIQVINCNFQKDQKCQKAHKNYSDNCCKWIRKEEFPGRLFLGDFWTIKGISRKILGLSLLKELIVKGLRLSLLMNMLIIINSIIRSIWRKLVKSRVFIDYWSILMITS